VKYGLPVSWIVTTGKASEHAQFDPLLELAAENGFELKTVIVDRGYDYAPVYCACHRRGIKNRLPSEKR
jgi:hypothetical protein